MNKALGYAYLGIMLIMISDAIFMLILKQLPGIAESHPLSSALIFLGAMCILLTLSFVALKKEKLSNITLISAFFLVIIGLIIGLQ